MSDLYTLKKAGSYRRKQKDKAIKVIWYDPEKGRDRAKAFKWIGPALEHASWARRMTADANPLIVNLASERVTIDNELLLGTRRLRPEERERVKAMKFTRDPR